MYLTFSTTTGPNPLMMSTCGETLLLLHTHLNTLFIKKYSAMFCRWLVFLSNDFCFLKLTTTTKHKLFKMFLLRQKLKIFFS